jgi:acyl-CoA synthetase (NDP forming)
MSNVVETVLEHAAREGRTSLLEHEVYEILRQADLDVPRHLFWPASPESGLPEEVRQFLAEVPSEHVVLKIVSPQILHKTDVGGLVFVPREKEKVLNGARRIWAETGRRVAQADRRGILVMEKVPASGGGLASELLLSVKQDPAFGTVLVLGFGGVLTEWYGSFSQGASTMILQPGTVRQSILDLMTVLPAASFLFQPSRRHAVAPLDLEKTVERLEALGRLAGSFGFDAGGTRFTLEELEMNPMLLALDGRWVAVDGVGRFSETKVRRQTRPLHKVGKLLKPRSAVVIGASARGPNPGRIILQNLKASEGVTYGRLFAVHPKEEAIDGVPCVRSLDALPSKVDMAVVAIPAEGARDSIRSLCKTGLAESIILIPGGFAETGKKGLEEEIITALTESRSREDGGPVLLGGNCLGVVSKRQYNTFFLPHYKLPFHDASGDNLVVVSQSGAYLVSFTSNLDGIVFPLASISYGNQMDLTVADFLEYFLDQEGVRVIACYIEGFKPLDGERFIALAREARRRGKRVIAFKAGKTALGAKATQSHTASLAGDYAVAQYLMQEAGVVLAETLNMFEDYTKVFTLLSDRKPQGRRVGIISNAGFECSAVLDKLYNLDAAVLAPETLDKLRSCLPDIAHADNPIDATPMATTLQFVEAAEALLEDPGVDALLISPIPVTAALDNLEPNLAGVHSENIFGPHSLPQEMLRIFRQTRKPIVVSVDSGRLYDPFVLLLERGGIPTFRKIDRASRALAVLCTM